MIRFILEKITEKENLSLEESYSLMESIMNGEINNSHLAGLLLALKTKGETAVELAGFVKAMRNKCIKISLPSENSIDMCGTGGDYSGTFNISTAASFVVAGAGIFVAKHGNRSVSSKCGSADVLKELGVNISLSPEESENALRETGITFLFAPIYHPSMKNAAPVRSELGIKTIFNMLGPLTNPAGTKRQLIGTFSKRAAEIMCRASEYLDMEKVCFVNTGNQFDEISLTGDTSVDEYSSGLGIKQYILNSEDFGFSKIDFDSLKGENAKENAKIIWESLQGKEKTEHYKVITANAAMGLYCAGYSNDLIECTSAAEDSIQSGQAFGKLKSLCTFGAGR